MIAICATCGGDLTIVDEAYNGKDIMMPLISVTVAPCCTCMSRSASEAEDREGKYDE